MATVVHLLHLINGVCRIGLLLLFLEIFSILVLKLYSFCEFLISRVFIIMLRMSGRPNLILFKFVVGYGSFFF